MFTTFIFIIVVLVIFSIFIGINASSTIDNPYLYMLFWLMFFISIATVVNIVFTGYFYLVMRNKKGKRGQQGVRGDMGDSGQLGKCETDCKNGLCSSSILEHILTVLNREEKATRGSDIEPLQLADIKNVYLKSKVKSICGSLEFQKLAPVKGQSDLVNYLKAIWEEITVLLYRSGGLNYFKSVGAENDWDWVANNPWDEFKKYDVYYWGLGKEYRPRIKDKCVAEPGRGPANDQYPPGTAFTGNPKSGTSAYKTPSKKASKYSILSYINVPNSQLDSDLMDSVSAKNTRTGQKLKLYNAYTYEPNADIKAKYDAGELSKTARPVKPMSYLVGIPGQKDSCYSTTKSGSIIPKPCDPYDASQVYELELDNAKPDQFKIKGGSGSAPAYITNKSGSKYLSQSTKGDVYKWS